MATVTIGKLVVDLDKLSEGSAEALEAFEAGGEMTDAVIAGLAEWSALNPSSGGADGSESKSSKIRRMHAAGMAPGAIASALDVRFQFVYNVLHKPAKRA
jgi:hypothetical protein